MQVRLTDNEKITILNAIQARHQKHCAESLIEGKHPRALVDVKNRLKDEIFSVERFAKHFFNGLINGEVSEMYREKELELFAIELQRLFVLANPKGFNRKLWNKLEKELNC